LISPSGSSEDQCVAVCDPGFGYASTRTTA
jgi:hypothetical protein